MHADGGTASSGAWLSPTRFLSFLAKQAVVRMQTVTMQAMEAVSQRLRDKKLSVRREAATQLAAVFR